MNIERLLIALKVNDLQIVRSEIRNDEDFKNNLEAVSKKFPPELLEELEMATSYMFIQGMMKAFNAIKSIHDGDEEE